MSNFPPLSEEQKRSMSANDIATYKEWGQTDVCYICGPEGDGVDCMKCLPGLISD